MSPLGQLIEVEFTGLEPHCAWMVSVHMLATNTSSCERLKVSDNLWISSDIDGRLLVQVLRAALGTECCACNGEALIAEVNMTMDTHMNLRGAPNGTFSEGTILVREDSGVVAVLKFAKDVAQGIPMDRLESQQQMTFDLKLLEGNPSIFSQPPHISEDGTISFHVLPHHYGVLRYNVTLIDNGCQLDAFVTDGCMEHHCKDVDGTWSETRSCLMHSNSSSCVVEFTGLEPSTSWTVSVTIKSSNASSCEQCNVYGNHRKVPDINGSLPVQVNRAVFGSECSACHGEDLVAEVTITEDTAQSSATPGHPHFNILRTLPPSTMCGRGLTGNVGKERLMSVKEGTVR